ncbi:hypothetical protein [Streptomyces sp. NPDC006784]|uniref:hypothetical protein n=1 Tax=Streptomyces sp. NPDC006784 TaxID=3364764 RepID=UPI003694B398
MTTTKTPHPLEWLPTGHTVTMLPAGQWWDAVSLPRPLGETVLLALRGESGAVIEDTSNGRLYWLVEPATGGELAVVPEVLVHSGTALLAVPGAQRTAGPCWRVPPTRARQLTRASSLAEAAVTAAAVSGCVS